MNRTDEFGLSRRSRQVETQAERRDLDRVGRGQRRALLGDVADADFLVEM